MSPPSVSREFDRWAEAFGRVWSNVRNVEVTACPTCEVNALKLVYVVEQVDAAHGMFAFWCEACLTGFPPGVGPIARDAERVLRGAEVVPNYRTAVDV